MKGELGMVLSALVIHADEGIRDLGDLLAIARAEAQKKHGIKHCRVEVREMVYLPRLRVYVAVYKAPDVGGKGLKGGR